MNSSSPQRRPSLLYQKLGIKFKYSPEHLYCSFLIYKKRTRCYGDEICLTGKVKDNPLLVFERNIIEFWSKEIEVQIQYKGFILSFLIESIFFYTYCVLYSEDFSYNFTSKSGLNIVSDITL